MAPSSVQQTLFQAIDASLLYDLNDWRSLYTSIYTSQKQKIQEAFLILLHQYGWNTHILDHDQHIIYSESAHNAPYTLLFSLQYAPASSRRRDWQILLPFFSHLVALQIYKNRFGPLPINIKWLLVMEEATPYTTLERMISEQSSLLKADSCILYTTKHEISKEIGLPELTLGIKGHLSTDISIKTASSAIPIRYGSIAPNAAWQLIWALHAVKDAREDILIDGFYDDIMSVEDEAIEALSHLPETASHLAQSWGSEHLLLELQGIQQYYAHFLTPSCSITQMSSDNDPECIPRMAKAQLDFRLIPHQNPYEIFTKLQQHLLTQSAYPLHLQLRSASYPAYTSAQDPLVQQLQHNIQTIYDQPPTIIPLSSGLNPYEIFLRTKLTLPIIRIAMPEPPDVHTNEEQKYLAQSIKLQALFLANAQNYHLKASKPSSH
jgi:acetylornithine deacetylase/succinyl-diaminopimelate desuccinylase-like protein